MSKALSIVDLVNRFHRIREERLSYQRKADLLKKEQDNIELELLSRLGPEPVYATEAPYKALKVPIRNIIVNSWDTLGSHICDVGPTELVLLEQRISKTGVRTRWESGEMIPGVTWQDAFNLSYTKA